MKSHTIYNRFYIQVWNERDNVTWYEVMNAYAEEGWEVIQVFEVIDPVSKRPHVSLYCKRTIIT